MGDEDKVAERVVRPNSEELDKILGMPFPVLDDGFVRVVDYMGNDSSIVQAARVSYGAGTKAVSEDRGLIRYLLRHRHTTPFEMAEIKLHLRVPMDAWRQWIRHRTANVNEYSTRYSVAIDRAQETGPLEWRLQADNNKQGSDGFADQELGTHLTTREKELQSFAREVYDERINAGIAREQARKDLPLSTYTEAYWKMDLHNLLHFLGLRMDGHAQKEIRDYATTIGEKIVAPWVPIVWEAFQDYRMEGMFFTRLDKGVMSRLAQGDGEGAINFLTENGMLTPDGNGGYKRNRERAELETKMESIGFKLPWKVYESESLNKEAN